jgi:hypothetical protein
VRTSLALLAVMREMSGDKFAWRTEVYEFVRDPIAIRFAFWVIRERVGLEGGKAWRDLAATWNAEEAAFFAAAAYRIVIRLRKRPRLPIHLFRDEVPTREHGAGERQEQERLGEAPVGKSAALS